MEQRRRISQGDLVREIQAMVRANPKFAGHELPELELIPRPETLEASNWWANLPLTWTGSSPGERRAVRAALKAAQEQFDIDWG